MSDRTKYKRTIRGDDVQSPKTQWAHARVDVYDVLMAFKVTNPAVAHAVKKLLCAGQRGAKNRETDLREAIVSVERALELEADNE